MHSDLPFASYCRAPSRSIDATDAVYEGTIVSLHNETREWCAGRFHALVSELAMASGNTHGDKDKDQDRAEDAEDEFKLSDLTLFTKTLLVDDTEAPHGTIPSCWFLFLRHQS